MECKHLRVQLRKEKLLEFQDGASQGQNLQRKQPRKISSRKQHFRTGSEHGLTGFQAEGGERSMLFSSEAKLGRGRRGRGAVQEKDDQPA